MPLTQKKHANRPDFAARYSTSPMATNMLIRQIGHVKIGSRKLRRISSCIRLARCCNCGR